MHELNTPREEQILVTDVDLKRLLSLLDRHDDPLAESVEAELLRATIVAQRDVPADVVTMNSEVVYEDCATGARRTVQVAYPEEADASAGRVSILAPIGAALLGLRVGQEIDWPVVNRTKRIRVVQVSYQPESAGDFSR